MCGIAGLWTGQPTPTDEMARQVRAMTDSIRYRGPDGDGHYLSPRGHIALGHRRLAILDLAPTGNQPMVDATGRYALIFNGEIFNFRALRQPLKDRGVAFRSTGDCEVVLQMLIHEGVQALHKLRGMFALAFWDETRQTLLLARDRFGIKPMVYAEQAGNVAFGSEIKALRAIGYGSNKMDAAGFYYYLLWGAIASPATWLQDVHSLQPGHWRHYAIGQPVTTGQFADSRTIYQETNHRMTEDELRQRVGPAVEESVKLHLESDVPVGVFLSGGIDSSSIVSAVRQVTSNPVQTYNINFGESEFSEEPIADEVARLFETQHHTCRVTAQDFLKDWPIIFQHYDQPTLDAFNSYYVSKVVAEAGLKVVLSGTGGDEFFGGYPSFRWLLKINDRRHVLRWLGPLLQSFQKPHRREKWKHLCHVAGSAAESYRAVRGLFMPHEIESLAGPALLDSLSVTRERVHEIESSWFQGLGPESRLGTVSRLEVKQYLGAQLLRDIDVMAMAHSLEVRVPLVDHVLSETLWPALGQHPSLMNNKRLLYETLRQPLPRSVYDRPKQGFTFPMEQWVRTELKSMVREGMEVLAKEGWIGAQVPYQLEAAVQAGAIHWSRPWALAVCGQLAQMRSAA